MAGQVRSLGLPLLANGAADLDKVAQSSSKEDQEVIKALKASPWLVMTPATEGHTVDATENTPA